MIYHTVAEWLKLHPVPCRNALYDLMRQKLVPHVRVGRRILIPDDALEVLFEKQKGWS